MSQFVITEAQREQLILALALIAPSGAGKTLGALKIAKGMIDKRYPEMDEAAKWKKIGFIDTEHKRAKIYANTTRFGLEIGSFIHLDFTAPYTVDRFDDAVEALKKYGCEIVITDSISHFWEGDSGLLDLQQTKGGNFQAWREINPHYNNLVSLITGERHEIDMINCIRSKQKYEVSTSETGKLSVEKLGLQPVQRDSLEYEFQIVFSINMEHVATTLKDNSGLFEGYPQRIEKEVGEQLHAWLKDGKDVFAEKRAKEAAEAEEKKAMIETIRAYEKAPNKDLAAFATKGIKATEKKFGTLEKLPLGTLQTILGKFSDEQKRLEAEIEKAGEEMAKDLEKAQQERKQQEHADKVVKEGLLEVAKTFNIKDAEMMDIHTLQQSIKAAQKKKEAAPKEEVKRFKRNAYYYHPESDSYVMYLKGDVVPLDDSDFQLLQPIKKAEYDEGVRKQQA